MDKPTQMTDPPKHTYTKPEFRVYGNLGNITAAVGMTGKQDGGLMDGMTRTA